MAHFCDRCIRAVLFRCSVMGTDGIPFDHFVEATCEREAEARVRAIYGDRMISVRASCADTP